MKFIKKSWVLFFFLIHQFYYSQTDFSNNWEDFYSYNNVKDFVKVDNTIYALCDNSIFTYNVDTTELSKLSSVQGLSGEATSSIHYSKTFKRLVIGYENGLVEVVDDDGTITISSDIINFNQAGNKSINHIIEFNNKLYLSTPFAIVVYDIEKLEFGDTYFIGNGSSAITINKTTILNGSIVAATDDGIFTADLTNPNLIDFKNWQQRFSGSKFSSIDTFNNQLFLVENSRLLRLDTSGLTLVRTFSQSINTIKTTSSFLSVALENIAFILDVSLNTASQFSTTTNFDFNLNTVFFDNNNVFLGTKEFGILTTTTGSNNYTEIHPDGPLSNDVFSISALNNTLWVVYGGYNGFFGSNFKEAGFSNFNGEKWINTKYNPNFPIIDLNHVTIDPENNNRVFISSMGDTNDINSVSTGGLLVVEDNQPTIFYNHLNSTLSDIVPNEPNRVTVRVTASKFDSAGNLWVASLNFGEELKKLSSGGQWSSVDLSAIKTNPDILGIREIDIDRSNSKWIGTRRNGVYVYNENGDRKKALIATPNAGNLPDLNVRTVAVDRSNRVWLGTRFGLAVYNNASGVFEDNTPNAQPIVVNANEDGFGDRLLGDQTINSIAIDGADNKWFGTDNGGVLYTNPSGQTTLANFSKQNSPLPSNRILKIAVDKTLGKVYFATDKGIVAYNSKVAPFGDTLGEVYAYPNPALRNHATVTIDGRNGTNLPKGTNVKIVDVSGNLVYETNVIEGQQLQGGKVVWNKTNLAGRKVASGIYIVLLSNEDNSEQSVTKIAIVN